MFGSLFFKDTPDFVNYPLILHTSVFINTRLTFLVAIENMAKIKFSVMIDSYLKAKLFRLLFDDKTQITNLAYAIC